MNPAAENNNLLRKIGPRIPDKCYYLATVRSGEKRGRNPKVPAFVKAMFAGGTWGGGTAWREESGGPAKLEFMLVASRKAKAGFHVSRDAPDQL